MFLAFWLFVVFIVGAAIGSFLNVCIYRLPLEKSVLWPGSRCGHCFKQIRWYDNVPLLSYLFLRGRCRSCGAKFSMQYFWIELLTGLGFVGLFYLEIIDNIHRFTFLQQRAADVQWGVIPWQAWVVFGHHALLLSLLIVATCCDLIHREIPLTVTLPGTFLGLVGASLFPWPWPYTPAEGLRWVGDAPSWWIFFPGRGPELGLYPWPFWGPIPWGLEAGSWQLGLLTGVAGMLVGSFLLRGIRFLFGLGLGDEAMGLGDADLMMMAGAFLGWQPVVVAFFIGVFPAMVVGVLQRLWSGDNALAFGPWLAFGTVISFLFWNDIGPQVQVLFFHETLLAVLVIGSGVIMVVASYTIRMLRWLRGVPTT